MIGWNERILSYEDFEQFAESEQVEIVRADLPVCGLYAIVRGESVIAIHEDLSAHDLNYVSWHEMWHHLSDCPEIQFFTHGTKDKAELRAHLIAACALLPRPILLAKEFTEIADEYGYSRDLILFRARMYQQFKV